MDAKWEAFEVAFGNFDPGCCASMSEERFDELLKDNSIVRNLAKIPEEIRGWPPRPIDAARAAGANDG